MHLRPPPQRLALRRIVIVLAGLCALVIWLAGRSLREPVRVARPVSSEPRTTQQSPATEPPAVATSPSAKRELPREEIHPAPPRSGVDASNIYKDAFVLFNALTDAEKKMLRNPKEEVDAEAAAALFAKIQPILAKLREAMKADYCDWGLAPYGFDTTLSHIAPARDLAALALWAAAYRLPTEPAAAIEDLQTRARLGHHLSDLLIGGLVAVSFEASAVDLLRGQFAALPESVRTAAVEFVQASTVTADFARAFENEAEMSRRAIEDVLAKSDAEKANLFKGIVTADASPQAKAEAEKLMSLWKDPARVRAEAAYIEEVERQFARSLTLPSAEFDAWWKSTSEEIKSGHPIAAMVLPAMEGVQRRAQQRRVEQTLFVAGAEVLASGPAQLGRYRDPATGAPLQYVPTPTGFELRSTYKVKDKPVTMNFSTAPR